MQNDHFSRKLIQLHQRTIDIDAIIARREILCNLVLLDVRLEIQSALRQLQGGVATNRSKPLREFVRVSELRKVFAGNRKSLLRGVFGQMNVTQGTTSQPDRQTVVPLVQRCKSCNISG